ncbi:hypothetical protein MAE02_30730 [Microvirga aerophila]|uniref:Flavin reductase like domain-containing protein n=2 Tax=Microvirga aerophila TaxID=670291 RepID=A0A512BU97_9HYPH|nr:hypothetical protein MAE02_30730 [Microvirga aerophila]
MIAFSSEGLKDTPRNARDMGEFVFNLATESSAEQMNRSSERLPEGHDEFVHAQTPAGPSQVVRPPRVLGSPASLECIVTDVVQLRANSGRELDTYLVIGEVVGVHINEAFVTEGRFDTAKAQVLARCGYHDYTVVREIFQMLRPE